ncbi:hypothetical protein [Streptomyces sp. NPDC017941]|uniref:hypothetical protein n=1 Tax=Streptomyces sp. NPDC017941 TaxID=3365018 RepID=UPI0037953831
MAQDAATSPEKTKDKSAAATRNLAFQVVTIHLEGSVKDAKSASKSVTFPAPIARYSNGQPIVNVALKGFRLVYLDHLGNRLEYAQCEEMARVRVYDAQGTSVTVEAKALMAPAIPGVVSHTFKAAVEALVVAEIEGEGNSTGENNGGQDW